MTLSSTQRPRPRALAVLGLVSLSCLGAATAFGLSQGAGRAELTEAPRPFVHGRHVPKVWASGASAERLRDCRGCHVFSAEGTRDPQQVCLECHIVAEGNQSTFRPIFAEGWDTLANYRDEDDLFRHHTHAELACRVCHQPEEKFPVDPMPIRRGSAECTRCHGLEPTETEIELVPPMPGVDIPDSARSQLLEELNRNPNMDPGRLGDFHHSEHLADPDASFDLAALVGEGDRAGRCTSCHAPVILANTDTLQAERFLTDSCGQCHIGRRGPLEFGATIEPAESLAARTFSHADHLAYARGERDPAKSDVRGYELIEGEGCHACHEYDSRVRNFVVSDLSTHEGCRSCHTSTDWRAEKHGEWEEWGCTSCHTFDRPGALALDRPSVSVRRRRATGFIIDSQIHPHIAGETGTDLFQQSCSQCHRARVEELPSRLGTRAFSHATHLPPEPKPEQCALCHGSRVAAAATSAALSTTVDGARISPGDQTLAPLLGLTYDLRACDDCHRGGTPIPVQESFEEVRPTQVTDFSHAAHLGREAPDGATIDCMTCHEPNDVTGGPVGTRPSALACTQCHDHREGPRSEVSGQASAAELQRCSKCHVGPIPAAGTTLPVERSRLTRLIGSEGQFHPSDRDCSECHQAEWVPFSEADLVQGDHVFAEGGRHVDEFDVRVRHQHRDGFLKNEDGAMCFMCHWAYPVRGINPEDEDTRDDFGNELERAEPGSGKLRRFPGGQYRAQFGGRGI